MVCTYTNMWVKQESEMCTFVFNLLNSKWTLRYDTLFFQMLNQRPCFSSCNYVLCQVFTFPKWNICFTYASLGLCFQLAHYPVAMTTSLWTLLKYTIRIVCQTDKTSRDSGGWRVLNMKSYIDQKGLSFLFTCVCKQKRSQDLNINKFTLLEKEGNYF